MILPRTNRSSLIRGTTRREPGFVAPEKTSWSLTRAGHYLALITLLFWAAGFVWDRYAFLVVTAVLAPLLLLSVPFGRAVFRGLELRVNLPRRVVAGRPFRITVDARKTRGWIGAHGVRLVPGFLRGRPMILVHLSRGGRCRATEAYLIPRRGIYVLEWVRLTTHFPFGLVRRHAVVPVEQEIIVHPDPDRLHRPVLAPDGSRTRGDGFEVPRAGEDEFYGLRDHRPGDRMRNISWRVTARLGKLVVRQMRAQAEGELDVILHGRVTASRRVPVIVENAVSITAQLVRHAREEGCRLRLEVRGARPGVVLVDAHPFTYVRAMDLLAGFGPGREVRPDTFGRRRRRYATRKIHVLLGERPSERLHPDELVLDAARPGAFRALARGRQRS